MKGWLASVSMGEVVVSVRNSGNGIPPHDLPHVFERFYRVGVASNHGLTRFWFSLPLR